MSQRRGLSIATATYDDKRLKQLRAPARDAEQLAGVLRDPEIGQFDRVDILLDKPQGAIMAATHEFFSGSEITDLLVFHLTGHGLLEEDQELYFVMTHTDTTSLSATALPAAWLRTEVANCLSRQIILLLDCCNAEAFVPGLRIAHGRVIMTATSAVGLAYEGTGSDGELEASLFTGALVEGLRSGDADVDSHGLVSINELHRYVSQRIAERMPAMKPRIYNFGGDIVLAKAPHLAPASDPVPLDTHAEPEPPRPQGLVTGTATAAEPPPPPRRPTPARRLGWWTGTVQGETVADLRATIRDIPFYGDGRQWQTTGTDVRWSADGRLLLAYIETVSQGSGLDLAYELVVALAPERGEMQTYDFIGKAQEVGSGSRRLRASPSDIRLAKRSFGLGEKARWDVEVDDLQTGQQVRIPADRRDLKWSLAFSADDDELALWTFPAEMEAITLFSTTDGRETARLQVKTDGGQIKDLTWNASGDRLANKLTRDDLPEAVRWVVQIWHQYPGQRSRWWCPFRIPATVGNELAISPDSRHLAISHRVGGLRPEDGHELVTVWDTDTGEEEEVWRVNVPYAAEVLKPKELTPGFTYTDVDWKNVPHEWLEWQLRWAPDSHALAVVGGRSSRVTVVSADRQSSLDHDDRVTGIDWSPHDRLLATACDDRSVRVWDWQSDLQLARIAHPDPVAGIAVGSDGQRLATIDRAGLIRLWWPG